MSAGNDIQKKQPFVKFGIFLAYIIWSYVKFGTNDGYGSTPSAWVGVLTISPSDLFKQFLEERYSGYVLNWGVIGLYDA